MIKWILLVCLISFVIAYLMAGWHNEKLRADNLEEGMKILHENHVRDLQNIYQEVKKL